MFYRRYTVQLKAPDGSLRTMEKLFVCGNVVQIHDNENAPFSFNLAVSRGEGRDPIYVNRIAVSSKAPYLKSFREMRLGQQLTCEINIQVSERTNAQGIPYENLWLNNFEWGKRPGDGREPDF